MGEQTDLFRKSLEDYPGLMDDGQPVAAKSAFSYVPTQREQQPSERNVYNSIKPNQKAHSTYDQLFNQSDGYNNKLHRCDREHAKLRGLHVNNEEKVKVVPTLSSTVYGHKLQQFNDPPGRKHVRIGHVKSEFYSRNGINVRGTESFCLLRKSKHFLCKSLLQGKTKIVLKSEV